MNIINEKETVGWLTDIGLAESNGRLLLERYPAKAHLPMPVDTGRKTRLAAIIAPLYADFPESLLWINEFGIWPSCDNWNLFDGFRRSLGEDCPLYQKPGHVFSNNDIETVDSLLAMVLYFFWGAIVVSKQTDFLVKISHDEYIEVYARDEGTLSGIMGKIDSIMKD